MKLFNSKATIVMFNITNGFCWEASFDINTGLYTLSCEKYFKTPIEAEILGREIFVVKILRIMVNRNGRFY